MSTVIERAPASRLFSTSSLTTEDGLPDDNVRDLHLDAEGSLLVVTVGGLARAEPGAFCCAARVPL